MTKKLHIFVFTFTLLTYLSVYVSPDLFWIAGFFSLAIPILLLTNLLLLVSYAVRKHKVAVFPGLALLLGYQYLTASLSLHLSSSASETDTTFSVLNYNVRVFNIYEHLQPTHQQETSMLDWLVQENADVKCLQEFYNDSSSSTFNTTHALLKGGEYQSFVHPSLVNRIGAEFGLAIFSRFPITHRGEVVAEGDSIQYAIFADLTTPTGPIRVYNVHLRSMSIDANTLGDREKYPSIARKLKNGFTIRAQQVNHLLAHIQESPHPVVVAGDFNDLPYSYSYFLLRSALTNAFEAAGQGFGFSYNGKLPFLRIDNQFFSGTLRAHRFVTCQDVKFSDHHPLKTVYSLP